MIQRCVNIDWLEVYCLEDALTYPHDAEYFRRAGFHVEEREYGTPVYHEMFTLYDHYDQPLIEIRRNPKSAVGRQVNGVLDPNSCHVRLSNRTCYFNAPVQLLQQFLEQYGFHLQRISRLDICLDFVKFDYGDDPADFMDRYFKSRYSKINQANIRAHGRDMWDGRLWNSVSWGNPKSMISTKFYNKTMELREKSDKPYIRQAWCAAHLVDDADMLVKYVKKDDGTVDTIKPDIWRVEFSIKSSTRNWFIIEDVSGQKKKIRSIKHTLSMYTDKDKLLDMFFSLAEHYFHFKYYEKDKRKDRCRDKLLFRTNEKSIHYKLENVATVTSPEKSLQRLKMMLEKYRDEHCDPQLYKACNVVVAKLMEEQHTRSMPMPWDITEIQALRLLISRRLNARLPPSETLADIIAELKASDAIF